MTLRQMESQPLQLVPEYQYPARPVLPNSYIVKLSSTLQPMSSVQVWLVGGHWAFYHTSTAHHSSAFRHCSTANIPEHIREDIKILYVRCLFLAIRFTRWDKFSKAQREHRVHDDKPWGYLFVVFQSNSFVR